MKSSRLRRWQLINNGRDKVHRRTLSGPANEQETTPDGSKIPIRLRFRTVLGGGAQIRRASIGGSVTSCRRQ